MPTWARLIGTVIVWGMVPACLSLVSATEGAAQVIIVLILALAATGTSGFIWLGQAGDQRQAVRADEKTKRSASPRVDRLMNALDDEDLAELRARLLASDGEAPVSLDSLLDERDRTRRRER